MFPFEVVGSFEIDVPPSESDKVRQGIEAALVEAGARVHSSEGTPLGFTTRAFRPGRFFHADQLEFIDRGIIEVVPGTPTIVRYQLSTRRLLTLYAALGLWMVVTSIGMGASLIRLAPALLVAGLIALASIYSLARLGAIPLVRRAACSNGVGSGVCPSCGHLFVPGDYSEDAYVWACAVCGEDCRTSPS